MQAVPGPQHSLTSSNVQDLLEEQSRNPSSSLIDRIESAKRRANQVRVKMQQDLVSAPPLGGFFCLA